MTGLAQDIGYGLRMLRRAPGFTLVVVLTLAIGIGANTVLFSVVNGVLLRPLPYADPSRLALLAHDNLKESIAEDPMSYDTFLDFREQTGSFESVAGVSVPWTLVLARTDGPERIGAQWVSHGFFETLGVAPRLGRSFLPEEDRPGAERSVILSHELFVSRFDSNPAIVGQNVTINDVPAHVVGVMPPGFSFLEPVEAWLPLALNEVAARGRSVRIVKAVARLRPGVSLHTARTEARAIAARIETLHPESNTGMSATLTGLHERVTGGPRRALLILMGVVVFVLLIACANVASLLTARAAARRAEVAVRAALGAGRRRLVRQFLTESVVLGLLGGTAGLVMALWGIEMVRLFAPADLPRREELGIDPAVLLFTLLASIGTGILFGVAPALQIARTDPDRSLRAGGRGAGPHGSRTRRALVVSEVALALVLMVGAGLLVRSFGRLLAVDPGFATDDVLTLKMGLPRSYDTERRRVFYQQMHERLEALPGVVAAGAVTRMPLGEGVTATLDIEGRSVAEGNLPEVEFRRASPGYFEAMRIPLLSGRFFAPTDDAQAAPVLLVNQTAARRLWPGEDPLGRRARLGAGDESPWLTIVGVVGDVRHFGLDKGAPAEIYVPFEQNPPSYPMIALRAAGDPLALAAAARAALRELEPAAVIFDVLPMSERLAGSVAARRFPMVLLASFSAIALLLAALGIYGVLSYAVRQRTREIGVRLALGARQGDILRLVVRQGMVLAGAGLAIGLAGAFALTRLMGGLLFDVSANDPVVYALAPPLLLGAALVACWLPARRAAAVAPMEALRHE